MGISVFQGVLQEEDFAFGGPEDYVFSYSLERKGLFVVGARRGAGMFAVITSNVAC